MRGEAGSLGCVRGLRPRRLRDPLGLRRPRARPHLRRRRTASRHRLGRSLRSLGFGLPHQLLRHDPKPLRHALRLPILHAGKRVRRERDAQRMRHGNVRPELRQQTLWRQRRVRQLLQPRNLRRGPALRRGHVYRRHDVFDRRALSSQRLRGLRPLLPCRGHLLLERQLHRERAMLPRPDLPSHRSLLGRRRLPLALRRRSLCERRGVQQTGNERRSLPGQLVLPSHARHDMLSERDRTGVLRGARLPLESRHLLLRVLHTAAWLLQRGSRLLLR